MARPVVPENAKVAKVTVRALFDRRLHRAFLPSCAVASLSATARAAMAAPNATNADASEQFCMRRDGRDIGPQFASLYHCRAQQLAPRAMRAGNLAWGPASNTSPWTTAVNAHTLGMAEARVVGVLYRRMDDPRIELRALKGTVEQFAELVRTRCHAKDLLKLEDASGRIALRFGKCAGDMAICADLLLSGCVVAVLGRHAPLDAEEQGTVAFQHDAGAFDVIDVRLAGTLAQRTLPISTTPARYVAIVSGLALCGDVDFPSAVHKLLASLVGNADSGTLARVIVAGNGAVAWEPPIDALAHLQGLDRFLAILAAHVPVDYMCGSGDIGPGALPQPPLFNALLPEAVATGGLCLCTNPYACTIDGYVFVGSAGQPIEDAAAQFPPTQRDAGDAPLRVLSQTLACGHVAPTAPGTLHCHSFVHKDPFVINERPHVYFAGNQRLGNECLEAEHPDYWTRLVAVPRYSESTVGAIVELTDGCPCQLVKFTGL